MFNFSVSSAFGLAAYLVRATENLIESASVCVALSTTVGNTDELHLLEDVYIRTIFYVLNMVFPHMIFLVLFQN